MSFFLKINTMQFLLVAYDGTDPGAHARRLKARPGHLENVAVLKSAANSCLEELFLMTTEK